MEFEIRTLWLASLAARAAARSDDLATGCEAIDELEGIAMHGAPRTVSSARKVIRDLAASNKAPLAVYAMQALSRLQVA